MTITVQLFASYAESFGSKSLPIKLPEGATVEALIAALRNLAGGEKLPAHPLVAVNLVYATDGMKLNSGDEVALIPPVAGG